MTWRSRGLKFTSPASSYCASVACSYCVDHGQGWHSPTGSHTQQVRSLLDILVHGHGQSGFTACCTAPPGAMVSDVQHSATCSTLFVQTPFKNENEKKRTPRGRPQSLQETGKEGPSAERVVGGGGVSAPTILTGKREKGKEGPRLRDKKTPSRNGGPRRSTEAQGEGEEAVSASERGALRGRGGGGRGGVRRPKSSAGFKYA